MATIAKGDDAPSDGSTGGRSHRNFRKGNSSEQLVRHHHDFPTSLSQERGLALVSLGFAPVVPRPHGRRRRRSAEQGLIAIFQRGAVDGLNMIVPFGETRLLRAPAQHRDRAAWHGDWRRRRSRRLLRLQSAAGAAQAALGRARSSRSFTPAVRPTPRARTSTRRTTWSRPRRA